MKTKLRPIVYFLLIFQFVMWSCATIYDHYTFTETIETKLQAASLVNFSITSYTDHLIEIESLKNQLEKMVIYEEAKKKNGVTLKMWKYLNNSDSSIHKFLKLWSEKGTLSTDFSLEFAQNIEEIFDLMIDYETKKDQQSENALLQLLKT